MSPPASAYLTTLLQSLHAPSSTKDTQRLLSSSAYLLTLLSNPLNLSLLTSQILQAPALWTEPIDLRFCLRIINLFRSAAIELINYDETRHKQEKQNTDAFAPRNWPRPAKQAEHTRLDTDEWLVAVVKGTGSRDIVPAWKQALALAGLLIGFEADKKDLLRRGSRRALVAGLVKKINMAVKEPLGQENIGGHACALILAYTWALLEDREKMSLNWDALLPVLIRTALFSSEGYQGAFFLANVNNDVVQTPTGRFSWPDQSPSFLRVSTLAIQPLASSMGTFSRVIAYAIDHVRDAAIIQPLVNDLTVFANTLFEKWRDTRLSEVEKSDEGICFDDITNKKTLPLVWRLLQSCLFAVVVMLTSVIGRVLNDRRLASDIVAPHLASKILDTLRSLYFINIRFGSANGFSQHTFVHLAAIDVLSYHPQYTSAFLTSIRPMSAHPTHSVHPLDLTTELYFLNTAEHFTSALPATFSSTILLPAALPHLTPSPNNPPTNTHTIDIELLEASHSLMLSIFSSPQNIHLALADLPNYITILFDVFPSALSARQFTLAFKTLLRIVTMPAVAVAVSSAQQGERMNEEERWAAMPEALVELLIQRIHATPLGVPLPQRGQLTPIDPNFATRHSEPDDGPKDIHTSLLLALISSLPLLPVPLLKHYLHTTAELVAAIPVTNVEARESKRLCQEALWSVLSSGEMDVERSEFAVGWWGSRGGRGVVLGERGRGGNGRGMDEMGGGVLGAKL